LGAFGEKLRKQREQRGLALDAISNTTKIGIRMLRALEEEHFDQLPGGVFNKGFVRAYARQVGLDEEESVADYLAALRESQIQRQSILPDFRAPAGKSSPAGATDLHSIAPPNNGLPAKHLSANDGSDREKLPRRKDRRKKANEDRRNRQEDVPSTPAPTAQPAAHVPQKVSPHRYPAGSPAQPAGDPSIRIPWGTLAAALLLVTLLLAFWNFRHRRDATAASSPATAPNQPPAPTPAPSPTQRSGSTASLTVGKASPAGTLSVGTKPAGTLSPGTVSTATTLSGPSPTVPAASPSSKTAASSAASTTGSVTSKPSANPSPATATAPSVKTKPTASVKPPSTFTLLIRAEKTAWISIVADAKPVAEETLIAPAHTSIRASHEIVVRTGNAAGVSFLLNGKEFPAQGNEGEVKTYIFDATGIRAEPQPAAPNR